jgi:hypothetical protein
MGLLIDSDVWKFMGTLFKWQMRRFVFDLTLRNSCPENG